jgi:uncharacterized OB-fold protein
MADKRPNRTLGAPHDDFWKFCAAGELRVQECAACSRLTWPPKKACEHCESAKLSWKRMSGNGKVISHCTFERDYYKGLFPIPWDTILVELEEGVLFISNPQGFTNADISFEMPVRLAFHPCEDAAGAFQLPVFERA